MKSSSCYRVSCRYARCTGIRYRLAKVLAGYSRRRRPSPLCWKISVRRVCSAKVTFASPARPDPLSLLGFCRARRRHCGLVGTCHTVFANLWVFCLGGGMRRTWVEILLKWKIGTACVTQLEFDFTHGCFCQLSVAGSGVGIHYFEGEVHFVWCW